MSRTQRGVIEAPYRGTLFGTTGIGKTSFAAHAESAIFLPTEEGTNELDVVRLRNEDGSAIKSYEETKSAIDWLMKDEHDYKTLVIDSIDWLNHWIEQVVCKKNNWSSIETPGYGRGYIALGEEWRSVLSTFEELQSARKMNILMLAHAHVKKFSPPDIEPFDRYMLKLPESVSALVHEWSHFVFFAQHEIVVPKKEGENKHQRGIDTGRRIMITSENASVRCKNRYCLPQVMTFDRDVYATVMKFRRMDPKKLLDELFTEFPKAHQDKDRAVWENELRGWFEKQPDKLFAVKRMRAGFESRSKEAT